MGYYILFVIRRHISRSVACNIVYFWNTKLLCYRCLLFHILGLLQDNKENGCHRVSKCYNTAGAIDIYIYSFKYLCDYVKIPNAPKGKLISFLITIEWIEDGENKHVVLHVREHKKGHYKARITHIKRRLN